MSETVGEIHKDPFRYVRIEALVIEDKCLSPIELACYVMHCYDGFGIEQCLSERCIEKFDLTREQYELIANELHCEGLVGLAWGD